jgi:hypothetical protein
MLDVAEHLYKPDQAFANLRQFIKPGGFIVVETGDVESSWVKRFGVGHWAYACLFEHHIFWSKQCFEYIAAQHGFRVLDVQRKRHKRASITPLRRKLVEAGKAGLYQLTPSGYRKLVRAVGRTGTQPRSSFTRDHFRVVLQREFEEMSTTTPRLQSTTVRPDNAPNTPSRQEHR